MSVHDVGKIQISQNLQFLRKEWRVQRFGWILFALILLMALLGVFGRGPIAHAKAGDDALEVRYDRILRHGADTDLKIRVGPGAAADTILRVNVTSSYLDMLQLSEIQPSPVRSGHHGNDAFLEFIRADPGHDVTIVIYAQPKGYGRLEGTVAVAGGPVVRLNQLILP